MIETLTPSQELDLLRCHSEYYQIGIDTSPADRITSERAITEMYQLIARPKPNFLWVDSPLSALPAITVLQQQAASLFDSLRVSLSVSLRDSLFDSLIDSLAASLRDSLFDSLRHSLSVSLRDSLSASLRDSLFDSLRRSLFDSLIDSLSVSLMDSLRELQADSTDSFFCGQQEAFWIAFYKFCGRLDVQYKSQDRMVLDLWDKIARSCGWFAPFERMVVVCERPITVSMEVTNRPDITRLHSTTGPALAFRDGWRIWALHGRRVPQQLVEAPETITVQQINDEINSDVKSLMLQAFGYERYLRETNAEFTQRDDWGTLWTIPRSDLPPIVLLEWINGTARPDGTYQRGFTRVNPRVRTAREAEASIRRLSAVGVNEFSPTEIT